MHVFNNDSLEAGALAGRAAQLRTQSRYSRVKYKQLQESVRPFKLLRDGMKKALARRSHSRGQSQRASTHYAEPLFLSAAAAASSSARAWFSESTYPAKTVTNTVRK